MPNIRFSEQCRFLYGGSCTTCGKVRALEDFYRDGIPQSSGRDVMQDVGIFKIVCGGTSDISQAYLAFRRTLEVHWNSDSNVRWCSYCAGNGIVYNTRAYEIAGRKGALDGDVIAKHLDNIKVSLLVDQLFSLDVARKAKLETLGPSNEVEEQEPGDGEYDIQEV